MVTHVLNHYTWVTEVGDLCEFSLMYIQAS